MDKQVIVFLSILFVMVLLFLSGRVAVDLVALAGLALLLCLDLLGPEEAFVGFSSPAVITLGSMFVIAAGLKESGLADQMATWIVKLFGSSETKLIAATMLIAGLISFFVNNVAVVALLMPAVVGISNKTEVSPSKLLLPMAFATILGGTGTLIGTTPNILIAEVMQSRKIAPFSFFDFAPFGSAMLLLGTLFMCTLGKYLLPDNGSSRQGRSNSKDKLSELYKLNDQIFSVMIPINSNLHRKTLRELRFAEILGVQVINIRRQGKLIQAPRGGVELQALDILTVGGLQENLQKILNLKGVKRGEFSKGISEQLKTKITGAKILIQDQKWAGKPVRSLQYLDRYGIAIVSLERKGGVPSNYLDLPIKQGDVLHIIGTPNTIEELSSEAGLEIRAEGLNIDQIIQQEISELVIPNDSALNGKTVKDASVLEKIGISILGIDREEMLLLAPTGREVLRSNDKLIVVGDLSQIELFESLGKLKIFDQEEGGDLESREVGIAEVTLAPRSNLIGKTLYEINFRQKYDLQALAIWRSGKPHRNDLTHLELRLGDALLLQGPRSKLNLLAEDSDFLLLSEVSSRPRGISRYFAIISFLLLILLPAFNIKPVHVSALIAALVCILSGTVKIGEIYKYIEWKILVLIAVLIAIGTAFQTSGAANLIAT
ncbi:MAG: SLC13 family permease, partial [Bdellovibrionales bacterium]|nr:SLC13 family permease [Bdellovibrionales bacterium]